MTGSPSLPKIAKIEGITSFLQLLVQGNRAPEGGGIYIKYLHDGTPSLGLGCIISGNEAYFGGGLFIGKVITLGGQIPLPVIMFNVSFFNNSGWYGGSNVAFYQLSIPIQAANISQNCIFSPPNSSLVTGYQNDQGFASCEFLSFICFF